MPVHLILIHHLLEVFLHFAESVWIAIGRGIAEDGTVGPHAHKVAPPSVDAYAPDVQSVPGGELQSFDHLIVQREDVPIDVSAGLDQGIVETGEFFQFHTAVGQRTYHCAATGGSEIYGKKAFLIFHDGFLVVCVQK
jgi:hypothetical protein